MLRYTDGSQVYTPASYAHVFVSKKNSRLYLIANILDKPTTGCDPRTVLQIVEMDIQTFGVIRDTLTVIEARDTKSQQPETIRFSNWVRYEDRKTDDLVVFITACPGDVGRHETCGVPPHAYRYGMTLHYPADGAWVISIRAIRGNNLHLNQRAATVREQDFSVSAPLRSRLV